MNTGNGSSPSDNSTSTHFNELQSATISKGSISEVMEVNIEYAGFSNKRLYSSEEFMQNVLSKDDEEGIAYFDIDLDLLFLQDKQDEEAVNNNQEKKSKKQLDSKDVMNLNMLHMNIKTFEHTKTEVLIRVGNDLIVVGKNSTASIKLNVETENNGDIFVLGNNSTLMVNAPLAHDNSEDITIVGDNSHVKISQSIGVDNGSDIIIVGNHSKVNIKGKLGSHKGCEKIILGDHAEYKFDGIAGVHCGNETIILGNNAKLSIKDVSGIRNGNTTFIVGDGMEYNLRGKKNNLQNRQDFVIGSEVSINSSVFENGDKIKIDSEKLKSYLEEIIQSANDILKNKAHEDLILLSNKFNG